MPKHLLILQDPHEWEQAKSYFKNNFDDFTILAWSPYVVDRLMQEQIDFKVIADYSEENFDSENLPRNILSYKNWSDLVDEEVFKYIPEIKEFGFYPFNCKFISWRKLFYIFFNEYDKIKIVRDKIAPERIYFFDNPENINFPFLKIMRMLKEHSKDEIYFPIQTDIQFKNLFKIDNLVSFWHTESILYKQIAKYFVQDHNYKNFTSLLSGIMNVNLSRKNNNILVCSKGWDITDYLKHFKKDKTFNFLFWDDLIAGNKQILELNYDFEKLLSSIEAISGQHPWMVRDHHNFFDFFKFAIIDFLKIELPRMIWTANKFSQLQKAFKFRMVLTPYPLTECEVIYYICDKFKIPSAVFLHGGTVGLIENFPCLPICIRNYLNYESYYFTYSEEITNFCNNLKLKYPNYNTKNMSIGALYYESLLKAGESFV